MEMFVLSRADGVSARWRSRTPGAGSRHGPSLAMAMPLILILTGLPVLAALPGFLLRQLMPCTLQ